MFYDRLLLITSLKSRLLSSSSFSQLYTSEKLPLRKFRREGLSLTPLIAGLLAACGGGTTYVPIGDVKVIGGGGDAGDGYVRVYVRKGVVEGAQVFIDSNNDGDYDKGTDVDLGLTDATGGVDVPEEHRGKKITVELAGATDLITGEKFEEGEAKTYTGTLPAGADETVVSPISTIIDALVDDETTVEDVLEMIFGEDSGITARHIANPDNYQLDAGNNPLGSPAGIADKIERTSIELEILLDESASSADIKTALEDGFDAEDDLSEAGKDKADKLIADTVARVGKPVALPNIQRNDDDDTLSGVTNFDEDTNVEIDVADWGFRDPAGNTDEAITELVSITISDITRTATDENGNIITDEKGDPSSIFTGDAAGELRLAARTLEDGTVVEPDAPAGTTITAADLTRLYFKPAANQSGVIKITYTVSDGEASSDSAELTFTIDSVNDEPSDIQLTGDRSNSDEDRADSTDGGLYVLVDGVIKTLAGANAGVLSVFDVEDGDSTESFEITATADFADNFAVTGDDRALFEIVTTEVSGSFVTTLKLKDDATPLADGGIYKITITYTDINGGTRSEDYEIVQGGLHVKLLDADGELTEGAQYVYNNGDGLVDENADGSTTAIVLGKFAREDAPAPSSTVTISYALTTDTDGNYDNDLVTVDPDGTIKFIGAESGDYDTATNGGVRDSLTIQITSSINAVNNFASAASFTGQEGADASGATGDADERTFSYSGGGITKTDKRAFDAFTPTPAEKAAVSFGTAPNTITFTADTAGVAGNSLIVAYDDGGAASTGVVLTFAGSTLTITYETTNTIADLVAAFAASGLSADITSRFDLTSAGATGTLLTAVFGADGSSTLTGGVDEGPDQTTVEAEASSATLGTTNTVTFTADTAGVAGDSLIVAYDDGGAANSGVVLTFSGSTLTITYETTNTIADLVAAFADSGLSTDITSRFDLTTAGDDTTLLTAVFGADGSTSLDGGVDFAQDDVAHRTINVLAGNIYLPDGTEISFAAATARVPATDGVNEYYVIVDDADGDGTYEARVVASLPDGDGYYVIGEVEALAVVAEAASYTAGDASASATFTAKTAGVAGNSYDVDTYASGVADTTILVELVGSGNVDINITYGDNATLQHLIDAFAEGTLAANIFALYDLTTSGDTSVLLSTLLPDGESYGLTGGAAAGVGADPTANVTGTNIDTANAKQLTWTQTEEKTHEYVINLKNIDDNAPAFTSDSSVAVSVTENADREATDVIFTAQAADADGETIVYTMAGGGGVFEIDSATGEVRLATGQTANYEVLDKHELIIAATSAFSGTLTITYEATNTIADLVAAFAAAGVSANITSRFDLTTDGADATLLSAVFGADGSMGLSGGAAAVASSVSLGTTNTITFTADAEGTGGNNLSVAYDDGGATGTGVVLTFAGGKTAEQTLIVDIVNVNEAPTGVSLSSEILTLPDDIPADGVLVGRIVVTDPDADDTHAFGLTGDDAHLFRVDEDGNLYFRGDNDETELKGPGQTYDVIITATDTGGAGLPSAPFPFAIIENGLRVTPPPANADPVYSEGAPLLKEEADGSSTAVVLGELSDLAGSTSFEANTAGFEVNADGELTYIGTGLDYEAPNGSGESVMVEIVAKKGITVENNFTGYNVSPADTNGANGGEAYGYNGGTITKTDTPEVEAAAALKATKTFGTGNTVTFTADTAGVAGNSESITFAGTGAVGTGIVLNYANNVLTITYEAASTIADLVTAFADGTVAANIAAVFDLTSAGADTTALSAVFGADGTSALADGADAVAEADAFRTINVDAGEIHLLDGTEIAYTGLTGLQVSVASWVIVDYDDGDSRYEARLVAKTETLSGEYYIIGEVGPYTDDPAAASPSASVTLTSSVNVSTEFVVVTANTAGPGFNGFKLVLTVNNNVQGSPIGTISYDGTDTIEITVNGSSANNGSITDFIAALMGDQSSLTINGETGTFSTFFTATVPTGVDASETPYDIGTPSGGLTFAGGSDVVIGVAAAKTFGTTNTVTFTADTAGVAGNSLIVAYDDGGAASTGVVLTFSGSTLTITYETTNTIADLVAAFAASGLSADITSRFDLTSAGADTTLLTATFGVDGSSTLAGGVDAFGQTGKKISNADLTLEDTTTYNYVVVLENLDDNPPVFGDAVQGETLPDGSYEDTTANPRTLSNVSENEDAPGDVVLLKVIAEDADGDPIEYDLKPDATTDNAFFSIGRLTGEIKLLASADYETKSTFTIKVTATSKGNLKDGGAASEVVETYTIKLNDENDKPTGARFMRDALFARSANIGTVIPLDPDSTGVINVAGREALDEWTFRLAPPTVPTPEDPNNPTTEELELIAAAEKQLADTNLFIIDANTGALSFKPGADGTVSDEPNNGVRKDLGYLYEVRVQVTDLAGETAIQILTIAEGTVTVGTDQYSGYTDAVGDGLVQENANFAALGKVAAGTAAIELGETYSPVGAELADIDSAGTILKIKAGIDYDSITVIFDVSSTGTGIGSTVKPLLNTADARNPIITFATTSTTINGTTLGAGISGDPDVDAIFIVTGGADWTINADTTYTITPDNDNDDFFIMTTAAVTIGSTSSDTSFEHTGVTSSDGGEFVVLTVTSGVVTGIGLKATLAAGDLVVGRLNADATKLTSFGLAGFDLELASGKITMDGYTPVTGTIAAQTNQLVYIGSDSGDFESKDTLVVDFSVTTVDLKSGTADRTDTASAANKYVLLQLSDNTITASASDSQTGHVLLGEVNAAGDAITLEDGIEAGILTISSFAVTLLKDKVIRYNAPTTERYVVQLADVNEVPTIEPPLDADNKSVIKLDEGATITITEAMLGLSDVDASDQGADGRLSGEMMLNVSGLVNGTFHIGGGDDAETSFTLAQVRAGEITFVHDGGEEYGVDANGFLGTTATTTKFVLTATDTGGLTSAPATFTPDVKAVNDAPKGTTDNPIKRQMTVLELNDQAAPDTDSTVAAQVTLGVDNLLTPDADNTPSQITYTLEERTTDDGQKVLLEHGRLQINEGTSSTPDWQTFSVADRRLTFTQQDIIEGKIRYLHDGSETTADKFNFTVSDGENTISGEVFNITVTEVNDQPTLTGDNAVTKDDAGAKEGLTYVFTEDDLGATDPDDDPENVTYIIGTLPAAAQGTLQVYDDAKVNSDGSTGDWVDAVGNTTTFTLADLIADKVRFVHSGAKPVATSFTYVVRDDGNDGPDGLPDGTGVVNSALQTFTLEFKEVNDEPSALDLGISRIDPLTAPGATVATLTTTDEETPDLTANPPENQTAFTYALVSGEGDNAYFEISGRELKFKSSADLKTAGLGGTELELKLEDDSYSITLTVTDVGVGSDPDQLAKSRTETYTIPVRSFDVDWDTSNSGVQNAPTIAVDLATNMITVGTTAAEGLFDGDGVAKAIAVGTFRIDPGNNIVLGEYAAGPGGLAGDYETDYGTVTVSRPKGSSGEAAQTFDVTFKINKDSELLKAIVGGTIESVGFSVEVRYTRDGALEASFPLAPEVDGFRRSLAIFTIDFAGKNDPPEAVDFVVFEDTDKVGTTTGAWRFIDPDTGATIAPNGLLVTGASGTAVDTDITFGLDPTDAGYVGSDTVDGTYGTLTVNADGTWSYTRGDTTTVDPVPLTGNTDVFKINVRDDKNVVSETALTITIKIEGENDPPTLQANNAVGTNIVTSTRTTSTDDLPDATVTELTPATPSTVVITDTVAIAAATAAQKTSGQWRAHDVDDGATMRLFSGDNEIGTIDTTTPLPPPLTFQGRYGTITFTTPNSGADAGIWKWEYVLNARAEKIAHGQMPKEVFNLKVVDEYGVESKPIVLTITITGTNDAPTALVSGDPTTSDDATPITDKGTVVESGFRTDSNAGDKTVSMGDLGNPTLATETDTTKERIADGDHASDTPNDAEGTPVISGQLDAVDIDRVGEDGKPFSAIDVHTFQIWGAAGATSQAVHVNGVGGVTVVTDSSSGTAVVTDTSFVGTYGTLELEIDGIWTYRLNNQDSAVYGLNVGDTPITDTFTIRIADKFGGEVSDTLVITITGTADAPILSVDQSSGKVNDLEAGEDGGIANATTAADGDASGVFTFTDDDANDTAFGATVQLQGRVGSAAFSDGSNTANTNKGTKYAGEYGDFYLKNDGNWSYEVDQDKAETQLLNANQPVIDSFDVHIKNTHSVTIDGTQRTITVLSNVITVRVDITGANDAPTVTLVTGATLKDAVVEDGVGTASGSLTIGDVDAAHDLKDLLVFVGNTSSTASTITTAVATPAQGAADTEVDITGLGAGVSGSTNYGDFTFKRTDAGEVSWTFELVDSAVQTLGDGQTATAKVWVRVNDGTLDGTVQEISVTITGTNDAPTVALASGADVVVDEDEAADANGNDASGSLTITDVDADDPLTGLDVFVGNTDNAVGNITTEVATPATGTTDVTITGLGAGITGVTDYGDFTFTRATDGTVSWKFILDDDAVDELDEGDIVTAKVWVRVNDGTLNSTVQEISVTITGVNDAPTLTVTETDGAVAEAGDGPDPDVAADLEASGSITFDDVDDGDNVGNLLVFVGDVNSVAGTDQALVTGTPVTVVSVGESAAITNGDYGDFVFTRAADGTVTWTFELDELAVAGLGAGTTATAKAWVRVNDGTDNSPVREISIDITGVEDSPTVSAPDSSVAEDGTTTTSGTITAGDSDADDTGFGVGLTLQGRIGNSGSWTDGSDTANSNKGASFAGTYGTFYLKANGAWSYELNNSAANVQALVSGNTVEDELNVRADDDDGDAGPASGLTIFISGANDAPNLVEGAAATGTSLGATLAKTVNAGATTVATINATDADAGETLTYTLGGTDVALFERNATTGAITFKTGPSFDTSATNDNTRTFTVTVSDGTLSDTVTVTVTIANVNTAPVFNSTGASGGTDVTTQSESVAENTAAATAVIDVGALAYDAEGNTLTYSLSGTDADDFNISGSGVLTFKVAPDYEVPTDSDTNNTYVVIVTATDPSNESDTVTITVTVTDVNENPVIDEGDGTDDGALAVRVVAGSNRVVTTISATDPDAGDTTLNYAVSDTTNFEISSAGELSFKADPTFSATPSENTITVTVTVSDNTTPTALTDTVAVTITVTEPNTSPIFTANGAAGTALTALTAVSIAENSAASTQVIDFSDFAYDANSGDTLTYALSGTDASAFTLDTATGELTINAAPNFETKSSYSVSITVSDSVSGSTDATASLTINVTDVDENPVIDEGDGTDDGALAVRVVAGSNRVVTTISATDDDAGDTTLNYAVSDTTNFEISSAGVLSFKADPAFSATPSENTITVTVTVSDNTSPTALTDTVAVTITVTEPNVSPIFTADGTSAGTDTSTLSASVDENSAANTQVIDFSDFAYDANSSDTLTYALSGTDASAFTLDTATGELTINAIPNFENKSSYSVSITVSDNVSGSTAATATVTISVDNVNELATGAAGAPTVAAGTVAGTRSSGYAAEGDTLTAPAASTITDPDGTATITEYEWQELIGSTWTEISGAKGASNTTYTLLAAQAGRKVRVKLTYNTPGPYTGAVIASAMVTVDTATTGTVTVTHTDVTGGTNVANQADQGEDLVATATLTDADDSSLTLAYQWQDETGANITTGGTSATLDKAYVDADGVYTVVVTALDDVAGVITTFTASINVGVVETGLIKPTADGLTEVNGTGSGDTLAGTSAAEIIQGDNDDDTITTGGGDDVVIGGYGRDTISLNVASGLFANGGGSSTDSETVVYRYGSVSAATVQAVDGGDTIHGFGRGNDKLIFVETGLTYQLSKSDISSNADITETILTDEFVSRTSTDANPVGISMSLDNNGEGDPDDGYDDAEIAAGARYQLVIQFTAAGYKYGVDVTDAGSDTAESSGAVVRLEFDAATTKWIEGSSSVTGVGTVHHWSLIADNVVATTDPTAYDKFTITSVRGLRFLFGEVDANYADISGNDDFLQFTIEDGLGVDILGIDVL